MRAIFYLKVDLGVLCWIVLKDCIVATNRANQAWIGHENKECVICLEELGKQPVGFLNGCIHNFHFKCLYNWCKGSLKIWNAAVHHGLVFDVTKSE